MKYLCLVYVEEHVLNGLPKPERQSLSDESMAFCNDLQEKGQLLAASPLHPVETATTVRVRAGTTATTEGPFAETNELVAGFWIWKVKSMEEAIEWVKRCPNPMTGPSEIEIRPVFEPEDFGEAFTPELREKEEKLREKLGNK